MSRDAPTADSDPGPATCGSCGDVYTKIGRANRGVCPDCWSEITRCPDCGGTKQRHEDRCEACACDHPAYYLSDTGAGRTIDRCVQCDAVVNRGNGRWQTDVRGEEGA